jgi:hypothetical protein
MSLRWSSATDQLYAVSNSSPSLDLDFASNKSLLDNISGKNLITFSRASTGTYVGSDGLIKTSPVNLLTYSEDYTNWTGNSLVSVDNNIKAPDGTFTARYINASSAASALALLNAGVTNSTVKSIYVRTVSGTATVRILQDYRVAPLTTITEEWQRFEVQGNSSELNGGNFYAIDFRGTGYTATDVLIWGAQLEEGTTATDYIPTTSTISGAPRFDHDPVTGESLGLLIEESRTNLLTYSEEFNQWSKVNGSSVTSNQSIAPDGTNSADLITFSTDLFSQVYRNISGSVSGTYTCTVYVKSSSGPINARLVFGTGTLDFTSTDVWQRLQLTGSGSATQAFVITTPTDGGELLAWGAQVESGSFPTSYIPTTSSAVTRAADVAEITGTNFSSWYNQSEGTVFAEAQAVDVGTSQQLMHTYGASTTSNRGMYYLNNSNRPSAYWVNAGTNQALLQSSTPFAGFEGQAFKYVAAYGTDDFALGYNGGNLRFDTAGTPDSTIYRASIGSFNSASSFLNGHISRLAYYPYRLSDTILQEITS